jgi:branched-chain amino acid transport system substrate-binding protein
MRASLKRSLAGAALALAALAGAVPPAMASPDQQFIPLATYRVGAYASSGVQVWAGMIDYLRYINEVEGGINGVKLVWQECETEWTAEKGIECYERFKNGLDGAPVAVYQPNGAPAAYALSERAEVDKIPLITLGYGRTEATDGTVFPYNFPVMLTFYSEASTLVNYIAQREGGFDKLKGKKIATVYHDSAYGRETLGPLKLLAEKYGFENIQIPVADPGNEQSAMAPGAPGQPGLGVPAHLGRVHPGGGEDRRAFRLPGRPHHWRYLGQLQRRRAAGRCLRQRLPGAHAVPGRRGFRDPQTPQAIHPR